MLYSAEGLMNQIIGGTLILLAGLLVQPAAAQLMICHMIERSVCEPGRGCKNAELAPMQAKVDLAAQSYERCDAKGCDQYEARVSRSGDFTNIDLPGRAAFARIGPDGLFSEVITLTLMVVVSYGRCR